MIIGELTSGPRIIKLGAPHGESINTLVFNIRGQGHFVENVMDTQIIVELRIINPGTLNLHGEGMIPVDFQGWRMKVKDNGNILGKPSSVP